eukprot:TRINITY_DN3825_c0_g1_i9.p1 TRINITY_DN3825_c0_g1~~TRINITY_DN3825_c0_g1_i9.p1  ORF type:complete len:1096 (-),score=180.73 TRINITY_DN3825_c0_g1_i9:110-3397(-)
MFSFLLSGIILVEFLLGSCQAKALLDGNGYKDFLVAIDPQEKQDDFLIDQIKDMMTDMNSELFQSTGNRTFIRNVKILVPETWSVNATKAPEGESYDNADFRITSKERYCNFLPTTKRSPNCGQPGDFTTIPTGFVKNPFPSFSNGSLVGGVTSKGRHLVYEFAKLRWGVFEEHGYPGDIHFPDFYLKSENSTASIQPNVFATERASGYALNYRFQCAQDERGMPEERCTFYPHKNQQKSSIMSLPELVNRFNFDQEDGNDSKEDLPNRQNLHCGYQSVGDIIKGSEDFAGNSSSNNALPSFPGRPIFTIIQQIDISDEKIVVVLDTSGSMNGLGRIESAKAALKRWIAFDIPDGVELGFISIARNIAFGNSFGLTTVNSTTREFFYEKIDSIPTPSGATCNHKGLDTALFSRDYFGSALGGTIVFIADGPGKPFCGGPEAMARSTFKMRQQKKKVIGISIGTTAEPQMVRQAELTDGKVYGIVDKLGPEYFRDSLSETLSRQNGLLNSRVTIFQKSYTYESSSLEVAGSFIVDDYIGKNVEFKIDIKNNTLNCTEELTVTISGPQCNEHQTTFTCSEENIGTLIIPFPMLNIPTANSGTWQFSLSHNESLESLSVYVTSEPRNAVDYPISIDCSIRHWQEYGTTNISKVAVEARVQNGDLPVIGATVKAYILQANLADNQEPMMLDLLDNGSGQDLNENDGSYTRFVTPLTDKGWYSVQCVAEGNDQTQTLSSHKFPEDKCGSSNWLDSTAKASSTGYFRRHASAGAFYLPESQGSSPPVRVTDLEVKGSCENSVLEFTAPGNELDSYDPVKEYIIKFSTSSAKLRLDDLNDFNSESSTEGTLSEEHLLSGSSLQPVNGTTKASLSLNMSRFQTDVPTYFAIQSISSTGLNSSVSNIVNNFCGNINRSFLDNNNHGVSSSTTAVPTTTTTTTTTTTITTTTTLDPSACIVKNKMRRIKNAKTKGISQTACKEKCYNNGNCIGWAYNTRNRLCFNINSMLRNRNNQFYGPSVARDFGGDRPCLIEKPTDCEIAKKRLRMAKLSQRTLSSPLACQTLCQGTSGCSQWNFARSKCVLYGAKFSNANRWVSGLNFCQI